MDIFDLRAKYIDAGKREIEPDSDFLKDGIDLDTEPVERNYSGSRGEDIPAMCRMGCGDLVTVSDRWGVCRECRLTGMGYNAS
jgi:hypothetical protein